MPAFKDFYERMIATHSNPQVRRLMASVGVLDFAVAAVSLFEPIYLYGLGLDLRLILAFYAAVYALYFLLLPLGARLSGHWGLNHAILFSSPFLIGYYLLLLAAKSSPWILLLAAPVFAVQKILYWPSFDQEMARFGQAAERGKELSNVASLSGLSSFLGPVFGGIMAATVGFPVLFGVVSILILVSNIPLMSMPDKKSPDGFSWRAAMSRVFDPANRAQLMTGFGFGEELLLLVIWPIFIFTTVHGLAETGSIVSLSVLISILSVLYIGRLSDLQSRHALLKSGTIFTAASWLLRMFIRAPLAVLGADVFGRISRGLVAVPLISIVFNRARKSGVLETVVSFQMALALGKLAAALIGILLLTVMPGRFEPLFILAAALALLYARVP